MTGAAKRVGREIALALAGAGYDIALHYHASEADAKAAAEEIASLGRRCVTLRADLAELDALPGLVKDARAAFPHLRHLVNNASVFDQGTLMESDAALMSRQMRINFEAPALLTQAFVREAGEGSVTNIIDAKITRTRHSYFFYLLSKKSLADFTLMAAAELGPQVRVNAVAPGIVMPSSDGMWAEAYMREEAERLPLKKTALPADVARAVHFLVSSPALTGQIIWLDGGGRLV